MKKTQKEKCDCYDYALVETASQDLVLNNARLKKEGKPKNNFVCICIHCRTKAVNREELKHADDCCFHP